MTALIITASIITVFFIGLPVVNAIDDYMRNHNNETTEVKENEKSKI